MDRRELFPRSIQYLIAIAEHASFTRAAEHLNVTQPTLSQQIKQMEETLGVQLIDRSARAVRLTDAGKVYLHHARRAVGELKAGARAIHDVETMSRGTLRLGWTPVTDCLTCSLLAQFNMHYPGIKLTALELSQNDIEAATSDGQIDIGIAFSTEGKLDKGIAGGLSVLTLFEGTLCLAVGSRHPLAGSDVEVDTGQLSTTALALLSSDFALRQHIDKHCRLVGVQPNVAMETNAVNVIIEMVRLGELATILPTTLVQRCPGLHIVHTVPVLPSHTVSLIWSQGGYVSAATRAFINLATYWSQPHVEAGQFRRDGTDLGVGRIGIQPI